MERLAGLVRELNLHQGDPVDRCDAETLRRDGLGDAPRFEAFLAEVDGAAVGYALVVPAYETGHGLPGLYLQDLFVTAAHRRGGIGRALLAAVAAEARARGLGFVWWAAKPWNTAAHAFFRRFAAVEEPVVAFATFGEAFERLAAEGGRARRPEAPGIE
jgi:GNAT superfamily N-acetyltransferase